MERSKKIVITAHCVLNQNSVVYPCARKMKDFSEKISGFLEKNIGIVQLPCPEMKIYGLKRWGHVKDQFMNTHFEDVSKALLEDYVKQVRDYIDNGYEILGVYGIDQSPSCGINETCVSSEWYGEIDTTDRKKIDSVSIIKEKGRFMEIFEKMLLEIGIKINFFNI